MKPLNREDTKVSFDLLMMKIYQIFIKLYDHFVKQITENAILTLIGVCIWSLPQSGYCHSAIKHSVLMATMQ